MSDFEVEIDRDLGENELLEAGPEGQEIVITRIEGKLFAIDKWCSHEKVNLADGALIGHEIFCPRHFSSFDVRTGEATAPPADSPIRTYPVTEVGGRVCVRLNAGGEATT